MSLFEHVQANDLALNDVTLERTDAMYNLNKWFFEEEFPTSQKDGITFDEFRRDLAVDPKSIKCIGRYNELMDAFSKEIAYNEELGLNLSMYTVYATVTNYLSRRIEKSGSKADATVQLERSSEKLKFFEKVIR